VVLEVAWLPKVMSLLRGEPKGAEVTVSSDHSPDLAEALVRGRLDVAILRPEPGNDLCYQVIARALTRIARGRFAP
jgi:LysR family hca operon transcriptional activator